MHFMTRNFGRINRRLLTLFIVAMVVIVTLMGVNYVALYRASRQNIVDIGKENAIRSAQDFNNYLLTSIDATELVAYTIDNLLDEDRDEAYIRAYLTQETHNYANAISENYTGIYGYIDGAYIDGTGWTPDEGYDATERPWYQAAVAAGGEIALVTPYVDAETGSVMMTVSKLLSDGKSAVAMDLTLDKLQEITDDIYYKQSRRTNYVMVMDPEGFVVAMSAKNEADAQQTKKNEDIVAKVTERLFEDGENHFEITVDGEKYLAYTESIRGGWYAISVLNEAHMFDSLWNLAFVSGAVLIITLLLVAMGFATMNRRQTEAEELNERLQSVAGIYNAVYMIDLDADKYEYISGESDGSMALGTWKDNAGADLLRVAGWLSDEQTREEFIKFTDLSTVDERLAGTNTATVEFLDCNNHWCRARFVVSVRKTDGTVHKLLFLVEVIDKERRQRDRLLYLSETDRMTGINNRGSGEAKITAMLADRTGGMFILLDADHFKSINDNYGHGVGDQVIISIAQALKLSFRENDVVLRLGGDEFAAYAPTIHTQEQGKPIVDRLIERVSAIEIEAMGKRKIEISVGVAFYQPDDTFSFEDLYKRADRCTYLSKKHRGSYASYHYDLL